MQNGCKYPDIACARSRKFECSELHRLDKTALDASDLRLIQTFFTMESGRWAEMTSDEIFGILSQTVENNVENTWKTLKKIKDEGNDVVTARIISEELLLTALSGSEGEETGVITAQIISEEQINV